MILKHPTPHEAVLDVEGNTITTLAGCMVWIFFCWFVFILPFQSYTGRVKLRIKRNNMKHIFHMALALVVSRICTGILKLETNGKSDPRIFGPHMLHKTSFLLAY